MYEYKGVIHVHTKFSDGSAKVEEIIRKAQKTDLDYLIIADHDTLDVMKYGYEGWHGGVLLLVGEEISPKRNHYLALGIKQEIKGKQWRGTIQTLIDLVKDEGGIGIIPHPYGANPIKSCDHSWTNWKYEGYDGLEIWSYMLDWVSKVNYISLLYYYRHPEKAIKGPNSITLRKWDEIAMKRHIVGIGSIDGHGRRVPIFRFIKFLPYEYLFRTIRTHILVSVPLKGAGEQVCRGAGEQIGKWAKKTGKRENEKTHYGKHGKNIGNTEDNNPKSVRRKEFRRKSEQSATLEASASRNPKSKKLVYDAIRSGHCFIGYDLIADSSGFRFTAIVDGENKILMGDEIEMDKSAFLRIETPLPSEIHLVRNGKSIKVQEGNTLIYETDRIGVYRVEVYLDAQPWIFSNPIFLR